MKKIFQVLWFLIAAAGIVTVAGCSRSGASSGRPGGKITIQAILPSNVQDFPSGVTENNNFIIDYWKEKTGYDFDITVLPLNEEREKLNMMFNAGEVYGIVFQKDMTALPRFQGQDLLQPFDNYMAGSTFFENFKAYQAKGILDGKQYGAVILPDGIPCGSGLYLVRKDIATQLGFSRQPETFEEFNRMLAAFKSAGKIPLSIFGSPGGQYGVTNSYGVWDMLQGFFGVTTYRNEWCVRDGKIVSRFTEPAVYDYLVYVKSLYDNEMIPRDFLSLTRMPQSSFTFPARRLP
jgi:ABC-type glycerol-3-phosphate transport system substrate-binding protein